MSLGRTGQRRERWEQGSEHVASLTRPQNGENRSSSDWPAGVF